MSKKKPNAEDVEILTKVPSPVNRDGRFKKYAQALAAGAVAVKSDWPADKAAGSRTLTVAAEYLRLKYGERVRQTQSDGSCVFYVEKC